MDAMRLPLELPIDPMLAKSAEKIPAGPGLAYEPKWDGFRCIISRDGDAITLGSRGKKTLEGYFPEVVAALADWLPDQVVVDAELVVRSGEPGAERLDWEALSARIHPAASRIALLAGKTPAEMICFDLLAADGDDLTGRPWAERRARLEALFEEAGEHPAIHLGKVTDDLAQAQEWFEAFEGAGLDGVVAKPTDGVYQQGKRGWTKVKHRRTAEAVVTGYRVHKRGHGVGSLLLGLYDADGTLLPVGGIVAFSDEMRDRLAEELEPLVLRDETGAPIVPDRPRSRFSKADEQVTIALQPDLVVEVAFDQLEGRRFRHAVTLLRFRPDRDPANCLLAQVDRAPSYDLARVLET